jgi:hypothetical protein
LFLASSLIHFTHRRNWALNLTVRGMCFMYNVTPTSIVLFYLKAKREQSRITYCHAYQC